MAAATKVKLRKSTFSYIESELFAYKQTLKEIEELRRDIMYCSENEDENTGGGKSNIPGRPTERIGTQLATNKKVKRLEEIAGAIERVFVALDEDKQKLVKLKYWTKPQAKTWFGIADELHISERQARRWRNDIVYEIAEKLGER